MHLAEVMEGKLDSTPAAPERKLQKAPVPHLHGEASATHHARLIGTSTIKSQFHQAPLQLWRASLSTHLNCEYSFEGEEGGVCHHDHI